MTSLVMVARAVSVGCLTASLLVTMLLDSPTAGGRGAGAGRHQEGQVSRPLPRHPPHPQCIQQTLSLHIRGGWVSVPCVKPLCVQGKLPLSGLCLARADPESDTTFNISGSVVLEYTVISACSEIVLSPPSCQCGGFLPGVIAGDRTAASVGLIQIQILVISLLTRNCIGRLNRCCAGILSFRVLLPYFSLD